MKLYIGNKNYSSWSFRPWMALSVHEIPFEEVLRPFDVENDFADFFEFSPTGKVPVLEDGAIKVWESLAIMEYVAERSPEKGLWPKDPARRAWARSVAHEMHAGFLALRGACPMNMRRRVEALAVDDAVRKDVRRIEAIWTETLKASGGPYLFGETYTIADAMYAPVVNRFEIYQLSKAPAVGRYTAAVKALKAWKAWEEAGRKEPWVVDIDEA